MKRKCPFCGHPVLLGADHCDACMASFTHRDLPQPTGGILQRDIMTKRIAEFIPNIPPIIVQRSTHIQEVIEKLQASPHHGCALVCDETGKLIGIVSIRDILHRVAGAIKNPQAHTIEEIMTPNPQTLQKEAPLAYALHNMSIGRYRHIPIIENGIPMGVVSLRDIIPYLAGDLPPKKWTL